MTTMESLRDFLREIAEDFPGKMINGNRLSARAKVLLEAHDKSVDLAANAINLNDVTVKRLQEALDKSPIYANAPAAMTFDDMVSDICRAIEAGTVPAVEASPHERRAGSRNDASSPLVRLSEVGEDSYAGPGGYTLKREYGTTPNGNPIGGFWVLRENGNWVDWSQYRNDLALIDANPAPPQECLTPSPRLR